MKTNNQKTVAGFRGDCQWKKGKSNWHGLCLSPLGHIDGRDWATDCFPSPSYWLERVFTLFYYSNYAALLSYSPPISPNLLLGSDSALWRATPLTHLPLASQRRQRFNDFWDQCYMRPTTETTHVSISALWKSEERRGNTKAEITLIPETTRLGQGFRKKIYI